mgnify:CR=1 FL=1
MTGINNTQTCRYKISETDNNGIIVYFIGELSIDTSASILSELIILFKKDIPSSLIIDLGNVTYFDDFGAFVLIELKKTVNKGKGVFSIVNSGDKTKDVLSLVDFDSYGSDLPVFKKINSQAQTRRRFNRRSILCQKSKNGHVRWGR